MRSTILISRITRLIETAGAAGDGCSLADAYAEAIKKVNSRLEGVSAAADAKVVSDAIRLISEEPPLLEEISTLDFFQLADWEALCEMNGWTTPPKIDKRLAERAVEIGETKDAIGPFLAMYKKAVRVNNAALAVKSLRRLVDLDKTQDWTKNLKQSERQLQGRLIEDFRAAAGNEEEQDRLAQELLSGVWLEAPSGRDVDDVKTYRDGREASKRNALGRENLEILRKCRDEKWDRKLAFGMVQAIDALVAKGWTVPEDGVPVLADCRERCAKEFEQEERDRLWKDLNERLHAAIQQEDCAAIRDALSAPEFLDRDPDNNMLDSAQAVLDHAETARRRKTMQIAVCSFLAILAVVSVSAWWLKQKMFVGRCEDEAGKLASIENQFKEKPAHAIAAMTSALANLKSSAPEVYEYPKVEAYEARLKALVAENLSRTNQIDQVLLKLEALQSAGWQGDVDSAAVKGLFEEVDRQLVKEDADYRVRTLNLRSSWLERQETLERQAREAATTFHATLIAHLKSVSARLKAELSTKELDADVENCKASLSEWRKQHSRYAADLEAELTAVEKDFNEAISAQEDYRKAIDSLLSASDAPAVLEARQTLIDYHGVYPEVKLLKAMPVTIDEVKAVLSGKSAEQKTLHTSDGGISADEFKGFLKDNILSIAESPEYYELYGLQVKGGDGSYFALSKGRPQILKPRAYEKKTTVSKDGRGLLNFKEQAMVNEMKGRDNEAVMMPVLMPSAVEMQTVVDLAGRTNISPVGFESELLKLIQGHIAAAHAKDYVADEERQVRAPRPYVGWYSSYCRVQFMNYYLQWLREDLKLMPSVIAEDRVVRRIEELAQPINIPNEVGDLAWACLWDERVKRRTVECAKFLSTVPTDWVARYRKARVIQREFEAIADWNVVYAGQVKFDPTDPKFAKDPSAIFVLAPNVQNDHPLYVLRKVNESLRLVRAFEAGKTSTWRMCSEAQRTPPGYLFGEPLYHVQARGTFIDVDVALAEIAKRNDFKTGDKTIFGIPLFGKGGN